MGDDIKDHGYVPSLDEFFQDVETNIHAAKNAPKKPKRTPEGGLKHDAMVAAGAWSKRTGVAIEYIPYFVGKVYFGEGKFKRPGYVGKMGTADVFIGLLGTTLAAEAKDKGKKVVAASQQAWFRERWIATGQPYVEYHTPEELIAALDKIRASRQ